MQTNLIVDGDFLCNHSLILPNQTNGILNILYHPNPIRQSTFYKLREKQGVSFGQSAESAGLSAAGGQCSLELHNGHAALALAVIAEAEGLDRFIAAQVCLHGLAQRAGALPWMMVTVSKWARRAASR